MRKIINLKKGLNLNLDGGLGLLTLDAVIKPECVAIAPDDFPGITPKLDVKEGESVEKGAPLMHDKYTANIRLVSPIEGIVKEIVRGPRRKIERVVVKNEAHAGAYDHKMLVTDFKVTPDIDNPEHIKQLLTGCGLWAMMRQRPYDIIPDPDIEPRDIFINAMDTAPLAIAPEAGIMVGHNYIALHVGSALKALKKLTRGNIYMCMSEGSNLPEFDDTVKIEFNQLHPAGNSGVQIANIAPVNKGEVVWVIDLWTLNRIGILLSENRLDTSTLVAVTGSEVIKPCLLETTIGANLSSLLKDNVKSNGRQHRIISGNVLTGTPESYEGYLRYPYRQITVIPEGNSRDEFMGWASLNTDSIAGRHSLLGMLLKKKITPDARLHGGRRAMIMSGVYEKYIPMDIEPEYLIKAIIAKDIDRMEALGIYEVAPEDFALAEYADPSKLELQRIVREGLEYMRKEA